MRTIVLWLAAIATLANGAVMSLAAETWWASVPGVDETGAFNPHFVRDVGAAYVAAGIAIAWFALRPHERAAAIVGLVFLGLHALFHLIDFGHGHGGGPAAVLGVIAPTIVTALAVLWPRSTEILKGEA